MKNQRNYLVVFLLVFFSIPSFAQYDCSVIDEICKVANELVSKGQYQNALSGLRKAKTLSGIRNCNEVYKIDLLIIKLNQDYGLDSNTYIGALDVKGNEEDADVLSIKEEVKKDNTRSRKFTEPVIRKDEQVREDNTLRWQEDLSQSETAIGVLDVKGNYEDADVLHIKEEVKREEPKVDEKPKENVNRIYEFVEEQASFPGGPAAMNQWLSENIHYPEAAQKNNIQGRVTVQFVVELNGSISNVVVVRGVDPNLDKEAVRVVKSMPNWTPGRQGGRAVRSKFTLPINFRLRDPIQVPELQMEELFDLR